MNQTVFKRYELKYRLNRRQFAELLNIMQTYMKPDRYGKSTIQSLYLDTPSFLLARRSLEHPLYKEKLRVRSYGLAGPADPVFIELKKKYESIVYKRRVEMTCEEAARYLYQGETVMDTQIMREIDFCRKRYEGLAPRVMLSYQREAWYGKEDHELRITFDDRILWRDKCLGMADGIFGAPLLKEDEVLMEVKVAASMPHWLVQFLSREKIYKTSFSKYGTAYQILSTPYHFYDVGGKRICSDNTNEFFCISCPRNYLKKEGDKKYA